MYSGYEEHYYFIPSVPREIVQKADTGNKQPSLIELFLCVELVLETNLGRRAVSVWVCGFAVVTLGYSVREHCLSQGAGMWETDVIHPLFKKKKICFLNIDDVELKRLENNHNKRKTKRNYMTY